MFDLKPYNTFGIKAKAHNFVAIDSTDTLISTLHQVPPPYFILGGGSNVLFTKDVAATVLHNQIKGIEIIDDQKEQVIVKVGGGEIWHQFVLWAIEHGLGGIENLSLIPGTVGASPIQNIGAYGVEIKSVFHQLEAIELATKTVNFFDKSQCDFGYRDSFFKKAGKGRFFITYVYFVLQKNPTLNIHYGDIAKTLESSDIKKPNIKDVSDAVIRIRQSKLPDPSELGNAGSFFKNPEVDEHVFTTFISKFPNAPYYKISENTYKIPAGWLIEQAGWKGHRIGDAGCHSKQALVLVNYGNATGNDIITLAENIQKDVFDKFGITILPEVNWV